MIKQSKQKMSPPSISNFKKRPLAHLITLTLSLSGLATVNQQAQAASCLTALPTTNVSSPISIGADCQIDSTDSVIINNGSLTNSNAVVIDNAGLLNIQTDLLSGLPIPELLNNGTLNNSGYTTGSVYGPSSPRPLPPFFINVGANSILASSSGGLINAHLGFYSPYQLPTYGTVTNSAGALMDNTGLILNASDVSFAFALDIRTLNNYGTLINSGSTDLSPLDSTTRPTPPIEFAGLINSSNGLGNESHLSNHSGATLENNGLLLNTSSYGGVSNFHNSGILNNNVTGHITNESYFGGISTLTNDGLLNNSGTLTNYGTIDNDTNGTFNNSAGGLVDNYGSINNSGTLTNSGDMYNYGDINNSGSFDISTSGTMENYDTFNNSAGGLVDNSGSINSSGTLTNYGTIDNDTNGTFNNSAGGLVENYGSINNSGTLTNNGDLYNNGDINNSGSFDISVSGTMENNGSFEQTAGSTVVNGAIYGTGSVNIQGGSLSGAGTIQADGGITIGQYAAVNPGNSPGTLILTSDTDFAGTLNTEIISNTVYDMVQVEGTVTLFDTTIFNFNFDSSYLAADMDTFDFLSAHEFIFDAGSFEDWLANAQFNVTGLASGFDWDISFIDNSAPALGLTVMSTGPAGKPVSAPATVTLFGIALAALGWNSRRRAKARAVSA